MTLRLVIEHSPTPQRKTEMRVAGGDVSIGRGAECDWQIEDAEMFVSRRHCVVSVRDGAYSVTDSSRGGVFIDGAQTPLGTGNSARVEHGTRLRLGDIVLRVEVERDAAAVPGPAARLAGGGTLGFDGDDFFARKSEPAPTPKRPETLPEPFDSGRATAAAPPPERRAAPPAFDDPFMMDPLGTPAGPAPAMPGRPGPAVPRDGAPAPVAGGARAARSAPDDGWGGGDFFGASTPAPPPGGQPEAQARSPGPDAGFALPPPDDADAARVVVRGAPVSSGEPWSSAPAAPPAPPDMAAAAPPGRPAAAATPPDEAADGLRDAFLRGLGLDPAALPDAPATEAEFEALGRRFRLLAEGLVNLLRARAKEKGSVRVAQTVIGSSDVNPLKFLATTDDALAALVSGRGKGYLGPEDAITGAYRDLTDHQLRTWVAVQSALRGMIDRFDPEAFEREADADGALKSILSGGRGARLWQLYRSRYREIATAAEDRFLGEVGADFRDAYEGNKGGTRDD